MSQDSQRPDERPDYPVEHVGHLAGQEEQPQPVAKKPWFAPNSSGVGYHPQTWQGVLVIVVIIVVVTFLIAALKKGWF